MQYLPTDEVLIQHLRKKILGEPLPSNAEIEVVDLYGRTEEQIREFIGSGGIKIVFVKNRKKNAAGTMINRSALGGSWNNRSGRKEVRDENRNLIGQKTSLEFRPGNKRYELIMDELELDESMIPENVQMEGWVVCRIMVKAKGESSVEPESDADSFFDYDRYAGDNQHLDSF